MSTTRSTSELPYTVVGEPHASASRIGVGALVLNRGGRPLRAETFEPFTTCGADEVLVILGPQPHYEVEQLAGRLPRTRFILLSREVTIGECLTIGIRESRSPFVLSLWSDMLPPTLCERTAERLVELDSVCTVPVIKTERNETVPSIVAPAFYRSLLRTVPTQPGAEGAPSICVYADTGVFRKERYENLGGYDPAIRNPYWQRLDFGFRAYLWGDRIRAMPTLRIGLTRPLPADDTTPDASYARFHLKNLGVRFLRDQGRLPLRLLLPFISRSGLGVSEAIRHFRDARDWVTRNRYRFTQDARRVTELWEVEP